jgi:hypothetical protein
MIETFTDKDQVLARYLFNELDESDAVELEDEMLLDDSLYQRAQVVEMNLIDGYVRNEMTPEESRRFKEKFLATLENRDKVNRAQVFHESLRLLHEKAQVAPSPIREQGWYQRAAGLIQRPLPALALIASVLLLIAVLVVVFERVRRPDNANSLATNHAPTNSNSVNPVTNDASNSSVTGGAPTPQLKLKPSVAPSTNTGLNGSRIEVAKNDPPNNTQREYINRQDRSSIERSGGNVVQISLGKKVTNLTLIYELLGDVPERETYGVSIKNKYDEPIWPQNDKNKEEIKPLIKEGGKRRRLFIISVQTSIFKDSGPYLLEFNDQHIPAKTFTIKK